jgi:hypothetical protein
MANWKRPLNDEEFADLLYRAIMQDEQTQEQDEEVYA